MKLQWNAKSKVGSLDNTTYKPGGGDKKIETVKLDFKDKAKPKVGSKDNAKHVPGGGSVKVKFVGVLSFISVTCRLKLIFTISQLYTFSSLLVIFYLSNLFLRTSKY